MNVVVKNARLLSKSKRYYSASALGLKEKALRKFWISQSFLGINLVASWSVRHARGRPGAGAAWSKAGNNTSSTGAGTVISLIWSEVGWINGYTGVTGAVPGRHSVFGIIGLAFFLGWKGNAHHGSFRAVGARKKSGNAADRGKHMGVAHFGWYGAFCKVFSVNCIAARIVGADTGNGKFAGFAADLCSFHAVRNGESRDHLNPRERGS